MYNDRVRKKAATLPDEIELVKEEDGTPIVEWDGRPVVMQMPWDVKLFVADRMIKQKKSFQVIMLRIIRAGAKKIERSRRERWGD